MKMSSYVLLLTAFILLVDVAIADDGGPGTRRLACQTDMDRGPCRAALERFFFNTETGRCDSFTYGGCKGNINRFIDADQCNEYCKTGVCSAATCMMECPTGFNVDDDGCRKCECLHTGQQLSPMDCPLMKCQAIHCPNGFKRNERGCETCECAPEVSHTGSKMGSGSSQCSPIMCNMYCANGMKKDSQGCDICACNDSPICPDSLLAMCNMYCEHGMKKDQNGCTICECNDSPTCPNPISVTCRIHCEHGFKIDDLGCPICQCNEAPVCPDENTINCAMHCPHGMKKDVRGCQICECNDEPTCPLSVGPTCSMYCENGFQTDDLGCPICKCQDEPPTCPKEMATCLMHCEYGFQKDIKGCDICKCRSPPVCPAIDEGDQAVCRMFCRYASGITSGHKGGQSSCGVCRCRVPSLTEVACDGMSMSCELDGCQHQRGALFDPDNLDDSQCWNDQCQDFECAEDEKCVVDYMTMIPKCVAGRRWCPNVKCKIFCERGFVTDKYGCDECRCRTEDKTTCSDDSPAESSCPYGNRFDENGCRTSECLPFPCDSEYKCADGSVCEAYRVKGCSFCPPVPRCIDVIYVQQAVISMDYEHETDDINVEEFKRVLPSSLGELMGVDSSMLMNLSVKTHSELLKTSINVHLVSNTSTADPYVSIQRLIVKLERGDDTIVIDVDGVLLIPDSTSLMTAYRSDDYEPIHEEEEDGLSVALIIAIVLGSLLVAAAIVIIIAIFCCCGNTKKESDYKPTPQRDMSTEYHA